jgi:hypothetical protein
MKRARILLSALGVLAVVGSALAFKANRAYLGNLRCSTFTTATTTTQTLLASQCTASTYTTTMPANGTIRFCTLSADNGAVCRATTRVLFNQ